jgi:hypothetical protein
MSEGYALILLLGALYFSECFLLVRRRSVAFVRPWGRGWKVAVPSSFLGSARGGLVLLNPLFPLGRVLVCHLSPVSISPDGVCAFNVQSVWKMGRPEQSSRTFTFDEITSCSADGKYLNINKERFAECGDAEQARRLSELINTAAGSSPAGREKLVRGYIAKRLDGDDASRRLKSEKTRSDMIRVCCFVFFLLLFLVVPALVSVYGLERLIIPTAVLMLASASCIAVLFFLAHRQLYPESREDRFSHLAKMILCPPGAIRAADALTTNLVANYDPVIVAALFRGGDTYDFVGSYVRDLQFPIKDELKDQLSIDIAQWYRAKLLDGALKQLEKMGRRPTPMTVAAADKGASYCPRCLGQFEIASGECVDCPGVRLIANSVTPAQAMGLKHG